MNTFYHPVFAPSSVKEHCLHFSEKDFNATFFTVHTRQNRTLPNNKTTAQNGVTVKSNGTSRKITRRQKQNIDPLQATLCFLGGSQGEGVTKFAFVHVVSRHMKNKGGNAHRVCRNRQELSHFSKHSSKFVHCRQSLQLPHAYLALLHDNQRHTKYLQITAQCDKNAAFQTVAFFFTIVYNVCYCARRGASGALLPTIRYSRAECCRRLSAWEAGLCKER